MDRAATIAWLEELAAELDVLTAPAPGPTLAERSRVNPTCGDRVDLRLVGGPEGVRVRGSVRGCTLSTAATVIAVRAVEGRPASEAATMITAAIGRRLSGGPAVLGGDLAVLAELDLVPLRRRCVALPWQLIADLLGAEDRPS